MTLSKHASESDDDNRHALFCLSSGTELQKIPPLATEEYEDRIKHGKSFI